MEVILKQQVKGIGKPGDIVKVSTGYARNFLFPKKLAVEATKENRMALKEKAVLSEEKSKREDRKREELVEAIASASCTIKKQASDDQRIFGSVTQVEIQKCLNEQGIQIEKKQINLKKAIKTLGVHPVKIKLGKGYDAVLKVWVEKQDK